MSHHGREGERDECAWDTLPWAASALQFIRNVAKEPDMDHTTRADKWLEVNGFECEASRRRQRDRRAEQLDAEIARLRAEMEKL